MNTTTKNINKDRQLTASMYSTPKSTLASNLISPPHTPKRPYSELQSSSKSLYNSEDSILPRLSDEEISDEAIIRLSPQIFLTPKKKQCSFNSTLFSTNGLISPPSTPRQPRRVLQLHSKLAFPWIHEDLFMPILKKEDEKGPIQNISIRFKPKIYGFPPVYINQSDFLASPKKRLVFGPSSPEWQQYDDLQLPQKLSTLQENTEDPFFPISDDETVAEKLFKRLKC